MTDQEAGTITIRDAELPRGMRNFKGEESQYNQKGSQNFCVLIDPDTAKVLKADGWNIRQLKDREIDGDTQVGANYLQVQLGWKVRPPHIIMIDGLGNRVKLDEGTVEVLDDFDYERVDLILRPRRWDPLDQSKIKAYLQTGFFTIVEDELMREYAQ